MTAKTQPLKTCACGRRYDAAQWAELRRLGTIDASAFLDDGPLLELRHCDCGSTISIEVPKTKP